MITRVQKAKTTIGYGSSSSTITFSLWPTDGNTLIITVGNNQATTGPGIVSISQSGATWAKAVSQSAVSGGYPANAEIWYAKNILSAAETISITTVGANWHGGAVIAAEYSALDPTAPLDLFATSSGASSSVVSTGTTTTTSQANELWIGSVTKTVGVDGATFSSPTNGFAVVDSGGVIYGCNGFLEKIVSATGTAGAAATCSDDTYNSGVGCIATFKAAGEGFTAVNRRTLGPRVGSRSIY